MTGELLDRIIVSRLIESPPEGYPLTPVQYLLGCYARALGELRNRAVTEVPELINLVHQCKDLIVSYTSLCMQGIAPQASACMQACKPCPPPPANFPGLTLLGFPPPGLTGRPGRGEGPSAAVGQP